MTHLDNTRPANCKCVVTPDGVENDECLIHHGYSELVPSTAAVDGPVMAQDTLGQIDREELLFQALRDVELALPGTLARMRSWYIDAAANPTFCEDQEDGELYDMLFRVAPPEGWLRAALDKQARYAI